MSARDDQARFLVAYDIQKDCYFARLDVQDKKGRTLFAISPPLSGIPASPPNSQSMAERAHRVVDAAVPLLALAIAEAMKKDGWILSDVVVPAVPYGWPVAPWMIPSDPIRLPL